MSTLNRRTFLGRAAVAAVVGSTTASSLVGCARGADSAGAAAAAVAGPRKLDKISIQLYTLRSLMKAGVEPVLSGVAEIGYDQVEFAGYFDHSPAEIRAMLDANGLVAPSVHVPLETMLADPDGSIEAATVIGHEYIVVPYIAENLRSDLDGYRKVCAQLNEIGATCKSAGIQLGYHNHDFEFSELEGAVPYDVMLEECDPQLVKMELDLFWITNGGKDPIAYFDRYPGRFHLCHVKDRTSDGKMVSVGAGVIDFASIFAKSDEAGLKYYVVEHDNPDDAMASARASYQHLSGLEF